MKLKRKDVCNSKHFPKKYRSIRKTAHFIYRQWDRRVDDSVLEKIFQKIPKFNPRKTIFIVSRVTLKALGIKGKNNMVVVMDGMVAVTLYFIDSMYEFLLDNANKGVELEIV